MEEEEEKLVAPERSSKPLVEIRAEMLAKGETEEDEKERIAKEELNLIKGLTAGRTLHSAKAYAQNIRYKRPIKTSWTPPSWAQKLTKEESEKYRRSISDKRWKMQVEGSDIPTPLPRFKDMKFPKPSICISNLFLVLKALKDKGVKFPTPIQMQGLPVALSGRDMIGIAYTGSGKTYCFSLPMIMRALEFELKMPLRRNEGPIGLVIVPSRELAQQTYEVIRHICKFLKKYGYPTLHTMLCMGGISRYDQNSVMKRGCHMCVATPGRLVDSLNRKDFCLDSLMYLCLDEGDRLIDEGFLLTWRLG